MSGREALMDSRSLRDLRRSVERAVMMSMGLTGLRGFKMVGDEKVETDFYSHDHYDEAMASLSELVRRANENQRLRRGLDV